MDWRFPYIFTNGDGTLKDYPDVKLVDFLCSLIRAADDKIPQYQEFILEYGMIIEQRSLYIPIYKSGQRRNVVNSTETSNSAKTWKKRTRAAKGICYERGLPDYFWTFCVSHYMDEIRYLNIMLRLQRGKQSTTYNNPVEITRLIRYRKKLFNQIILFATQLGGIFEGNSTQYIERVELQGSWWIHFHMMIFDFMKSFDPSELTLSKRCTSAMYPILKSLIDRLNHQHSNRCCWKGKDQQRHWILTCKPGYPFGPHLNHNNCLPGCRQPFRTHAQAYMSEWHQRILYLWESNLNLK